MKLFRKPNSKFYWYDFTVRGSRHRGSTPETKSVRALQVASLERIDENQPFNGKWTASFYCYDGHGSVRQLTNSSGAVTDTYDYDAFGNLVSLPGSTPNNYLFAGEQYDPALGLYYNRARYLNKVTGRFWSMDTREGSDLDPLSLHKYMFGEADPVDHRDRSGHEIDLIGVLAVAAIVLTLTAMATTPITNSARVEIHFDRLGWLPWTYSDSDLLRACGPSL